MIKLRVYGVPAPQGSTRAFAVRKGGLPTGRVVVTGDNPRTKPWRQAIIDAAGELDPATRWHDVSDALAVTLVFILPRPAAHYGTGANAAKVRPGAPSRPVGKRDDLDKLCRAVLDALTDAGAWRDDGQVADLNASKVYVSDGERPGCVIEVSSLG